MRMSFTVPGKPATAGSKKCYPMRRKDGTLGVRMVHDCDRFHSWKRSIHIYARAVKFHFDPKESETVPEFPIPHNVGISLDMTWVQQRPKTHFGTGRNAQVLRSSAPTHPTSKPDLTKVVRALEDSLTGILWVDDSQVVKHVTEKVYGDSDRLDVVVSTV